MTKAIEMAKKCGIEYFNTPEGTHEMHGNDRQVEALVEMVRADERGKICAAIEHSAREYGMMDSDDCLELIRD